jgi:hypothetical protein
VALGAALTGLFGITQTRQKRVQERRAEVYVDVLAWIWIRMPALQVKLHAGTHRPNGVDWPTSLSGFPVTTKKITLPSPEALSVQNTDPETPFFVALRSRVAVFASHDMARAFDRWVAAYKIALKVDNVDGGGATHSGKSEEICPDDCVRCAVLALATDEVAGTSPPTLWGWITGRVGSAEKRKSSDSGIKTDAYKLRITPWVVVGRERDTLDGTLGCLTKAVAACASAELRKG